ncbi:MAG: RNA polymerase sigma factor [Clostridiales bacterium]|nr:RNA polymerase sigma factor [Clostridiales bacterium]
MIAFTLDAAPGRSGRQDAETEECIRKIARGDKQALAQLYRDTGAAVYGFALSLLGNVQEAEDIQQDVFIRIWQSAGSYKAQGKPLAWIFTITRNLALMRFRDQKKTIAMTEEDWQAMFADQVQMDGEDRIILKSLIETLSREEQNIVMLHAVAQLKHREIAQILDLPLSTVLSKYNRALKKLKQAIKETDDSKGGRK